MSTSGSNLKFKLIAFSFLLFAGVTLSKAQKIDTVITRTAIIGSQDIVYVSSSMSDTEIRTWDKNELKVEYSLSIDANSAEDLREFLSKMTSELGGQLKNVKDGRVHANVKFTSIMKNNKNITVQFADDNKKYKLTEYESGLVVYMPAGNRLDLNSSFQEVRIGDLQNDANIRISSCRFSMGNCKHLEMDASFCKNMVAGNIESGKLRLNSSSLEMGEVKKGLELKGGFSEIDVEKIAEKADLILNSSTFETSEISELDLKGSFVRSFRANKIGKASIDLNSSKLEANHIDELKVVKTSFSTVDVNESPKISVDNSASSKYFIDRTDDMQVKYASFTHFEIGDLGKIFTVDASSGEMEIGNIDPGFEMILIAGKFFGVDLDFDDNASYSVSADLDFPNYEFRDLDINTHEKNMSHEWIEGQRKGSKNGMGRVKLNCSSCKIRVE